MGEPESLINLGGNNVLQAGKVAAARWDSDLPGKGVPTTVKNQFDYMGVMNKEITSKKWVSVQTPREDKAEDNKGEAGDKGGAAGGIDTSKSTGGQSAQGSSGSSSRDGDTSNQIADKYDDAAKQISHSSSQGSTNMRRGSKDTDSEAKSAVQTQEQFVERKVAKGLELDARTKYQASLGLSIADTSQVKLAQELDCPQNEEGGEDGAEPKKKWNPFPKEWVKNQDEIKKS
jgi:hypothetical protein